MKRALILAIFAIAVIAAPAQLFKSKKVAVENNVEIPVINGKVTFEETIPANGYTAEEVNAIINGWIKERYVKPTVISKKIFESGKPNTTVLKGEEYIVFRNTTFVLNRARIYYYLTLTANDGSCTFNMSRITYWHDEEDESGGIKMIAEEWITDENAIDRKGKVKKFEGKFRTKTVELKDKLVKELTEKLDRK